MTLTILGWIATAAYLVNHAYVSTRSEYRRGLYFGVNFAAASGIAVSSAALASWQAVATNVFWAAVSLAALLHVRIEGRIPLAERWIISPIFTLAALGAAWGLADLEAGMGLVGWAATALFCAAYLLFANAAVTRPRFLLYNVAAAYLFTPILFLHGNWPVFGLEVAWGAISFAGWRAAKRGARPAPQPMAAADLAYAEDAPAAEDPAAGDAPSRSRPPVRDPST